MKLRLLVALPLLLFALVANAQKLYKIVDEEGNVSFSQFPPAEKKENVTIDNIAVDSGPRTAVTETLDGTYCGDIKLPTRSSSSYSMKNYVKNMDRRRSSWQEQMDRLHQSIDRDNQNAIKQAKYQSRYNNGSSQNKRYQQSINSNGEKLRDLRCALDWADEEMDDTSEFVANNKAEKARLTEIRDELAMELDKNCGTIPAYDPTVGRNDAVRKRWYECSERLRREIDRVERAMAKI